MDGITQKAINELFVRTDILEREIKRTAKKVKKYKCFSAVLLLAILISRIEITYEEKTMND